MSKLLEILCPICHHHITTNSITEFMLVKNHTHELAYQCNNPKCKHLFIIEFDALNNRFTEILGPKKTKPIEFEDAIKNLSENFVKIYNQASEAESTGLDEISGIGYRKALEFLIKDYCIHKEPNKETEIKSNFLGKVLNEYLVEAPKLQSAAKKATWLGNDETHYVRKWEDKDISDLKKLIHIAVLHIEYEIELEKYEADMD